MMIQNKIGYKFNNEKMLERALTHASLHNLKCGNNENFEFLGDRVLGLIIADMLFTKFPYENEGMLAKRHTALVKQEALFKVAEKIELEKYIKISDGEAKTGGRKKQAILADAVEALIGAIYKDGGFDNAFAFVKKYWSEMMDGQDAPPEDAKSKLQELAQSKGLPLPEYLVVEKIGEDHNPQFTIEVKVEKLGKASAVASSKKQGEKLAAETLLKKLEKNSGR